MERDIVLQPRGAECLRYDHPLVSHNIGSEIVPVYFVHCSFFSLRVSMVRGRKRKKSSSSTSSDPHEQQADPNNIPTNSTSTTVSITNNKKKKRDTADIMWGSGSASHSAGASSHSRSSARNKSAQSRSSATENVSSCFVSSDAVHVTIHSCSKFFKF